MQQQAALMAASHGGYLTPSVAFPATQIHQMGALNINSLPPTPMTPVSGEFHQPLGEQLRFISSLTGTGDGGRQGFAQYWSACHLCELRD
ncbi:CUGBP Elav-like family member 5a isoform X1 [Tachysurus ichikawai]